MGHSTIGYSANSSATRDQNCRVAQSYATASPRANVGFLAFHRPAPSTIGVKLVAFARGLVGPWLFRSGNGQQVGAVFDPIRYGQRALMAMQQRPGTDILLRQNR